MKNRHFTIRFLTGLAAHFMMLVIASGCGFIPIQPNNQSSGSNLSGNSAGLGTEVATLPPASLAITGQSPILAGQCIPYLVTAVTSSGFPAQYFPAGTSVILSGIPNQIPVPGNFFSDSNCDPKNPVSSIDISSTNAATFYFRPQIVGTYILTGTINNNLSGKIPVIVQAGAAQAISITTLTPPTQNQCTAFQVQIVDGANNSVPVSGVTVGLSPSGSAASGVSFYTDAGCGTQITTGLPLGTNGGGMFYTYPETTGLLTITGTAGSYTPGVYNGTVNPGNLLRLVYNNPSSATAGMCLGVNFQVEDGSNTVRQLAFQTILNFTPGGSLKIFPSQANCLATTQTTTTSITLSVGTSSGTFWVQDLVAEPLITTNVKASGLADSPFTISFNAGFAAKLKVGVSNSSVVADSCAQETITLLDTYNNVTNQTLNAVDVIAQLLPVGAGTSFYSDSACSSNLAISTAKISSGTSSTTPFYFKPTVAGPLTLNALAQTSLNFSSTIPASVIVTTAKGSAGSLSLAGPTTIQSGQCSTLASPYVITTLDPSNASQPIDVNSNLTLTLTSPDNSTVIFYSDECITPITTITIAAGQSSNQFWIKSPKAFPAPASFEIDAAGSGLKAMLKISSQLGTPLLKIQTPTSIAANHCIGGGVLIEDANQNLIGLTSGATFSFSGVYSSGAGTVVFYSDASCSRAINASNPLGLNGNPTPFYYSASGVGNITLTANSSTGLTGTQNVGVSSSSLLLTLTPASSASMTTDSCSEVKVAIKNSDGSTANIASTQVSVVPQTPTNGAIFSAAGCTTPLTTGISLSNSQNPVSVWVKDPKIETFVINGNAYGNLNTSLTLQVGVGAPAKLILSGPSSFFVETCATGYSVKVTDANNNSVPWNGVQVTLLTSGPAANAQFSPSSQACPQGSAMNSVTLSGSDTGYFNLYGHQLGTLTVTAQLDSSHFTNKNFSVLPNSLSFSGAGIAFDPTVVGGSETKTVSFSNAGPLSVTATNAVIIGNDAANYQIVADTCSLPIVLSANQSCTLTVKFSPQSAGAKNAAQLGIGSSAGAIWTPITGTGVAQYVAPPPAALTLNYGSVNYHPEVANTASFDLVCVIVTNNGGSAATLSASTTDTADFFAVDSNVCGTPCSQVGSLAVGAACGQGIKFKPTQIGQLYATFHMGFTSAGGNGSAGLGLAGRGDAQLTCNGGVEQSVLPTIGQQYDQSIYGFSDPFVVTANTNLPANYVAGGSDHAANFAITGAAVNSPSSFSVAAATTNIAGWQTYAIGMQAADNELNQAICYFAIGTVPVQRQVIHAYFTNLVIDGDLQVVFDRAQQKISVCMLAPASDPTYRVFYLGNIAIGRSDGHTETVGLNYGGVNDVAVGTYHGGYCNPVNFNFPMLSNPLGQTNQAILNGLVQKANTATTDQQPNMFGNISEPDRLGSVDERFDVFLGAPNYLNLPFSATAATINIYEGGTLFSYEGKSYRKNGVANVGILYWF